MDKLFENLSIDIKNLVVASEEDYTEKRWSSYVDYMNEFNRIITKLISINIEVDIEKIIPVPSEKVGAYGRIGAGTISEQAKLREILNKAKRLQCRMILEENLNNLTITKNKKIFVSHSSKDKVFTDIFVDLLRIIGLRNDQIYYSSYEETGSDFLEDCLGRIKQEFQTNELMVIFMLSPYFYSSNICLAEMGATWVTINDNYVPVLLPPYDYNNIKGVIKSTQNSMMIYDKEISTKIEQFKDKIENFFEISEKVSSTEWQRNKSKFITFINETASSYEDVESVIEELIIVEKRIVLKIKLKNNTKNRLRFEDINVNINTNDDKEIHETINDWTITSVVLQPLESITFLTSFENEFLIKKSAIKLESNSVTASFYQEN